MSELRQTPLASSFRDPSGYIFKNDGDIYRQINPSYFENYSFLIESGLYASLTKKQLLVSHEMVEENEDKIIIKPENINYIAYPYEWCFSQLKDAATNTLLIQLEALKYGMTLKDASAFNTVQNQNSSIFIDTLSFDKYQDGDPWPAYGQFCSHFLCPLLLWSNKIDTPWHLGQSHLEGSDIELTSKLLPMKSYLSLTTLTNIHLHARAISKNQRDVTTNFSNATDHRRKIPLKSLINIIKSLLLKVENLDLVVNSKSSQWSNYYSITNYETDDFKLKKDTLAKWTDIGKFTKIWDIGANDGSFSRVVNKGARIIYSSDIDPYAVELNYRACKVQNLKNIVPFVANMTEPTSGYGYANEERQSLVHRMKNTRLDCIFALAVVHHLCLTGNCTFKMLAMNWSQMAESLVVEFVTPKDSWAQHLLEEKGKSKHLFSWYKRNLFERTFAEYYHISEFLELSEGKRILYSMRIK